MRNVFFIPPLARMSGGLAALVELANILAASGRPVAAVCPGQSPALNLLAPEAPLLPWPEVEKGAALSPDDLWCLPEGWPNAIAPGARAGARILVYVQNWAFMLGNLPPGVTWSRLPVAYLAVSEPVRWFMREVLGLGCEAILPPAVDPLFFKEARRPEHRLRVAFMPRKNKALGEQIRRIALEKLRADAFERPLDFVEISGRPLAEVAELLSSCHIFISTGFPEGFALPPIEGMASGCVPVGFSGLGGFEYMRNPGPGVQPGLHTPPFPLGQKPWGANGLFVSDGDVLAAGLALARAVKEASGRTELWAELVRNAKLTASAYTRDKREERAARIWDGLAARFQGLL